MISTPPNSNTITSGRTLLYPVWRYSTLITYYDAQTYARWDLNEHKDYRKPIYPSTPPREPLSKDWQKFSSQIAPLANGKLKLMKRLPSGHKH